MKAFNIKDGCGMNNSLIPDGVASVSILGRFSDVVMNRCKESCISVSDKLKNESDCIKSKISCLYSVTATSKWHNTVPLVCR